MIRFRGAVFITTGKMENKNINNIGLNGSLTKAGQKKEVNE